MLKAIEIITSNIKRNYQLIEQNVAGLNTYQTAIKNLQQEEMEVQGKPILGESEEDRAEQSNQKGEKVFMLQSKIKTLEEKSMHTARLVDELLKGQATLLTILAYHPAYLGVVRDIAEFKKIQAQKAEEAETAKLKAAAEEEAKAANENQNTNTAEETQQV